MDALRVGRSLRALRLRRALRQSDVARLAGLSRTQVARIELGEIRRIPLGDVVAVAAALGADVDVRIRWHGEALDRLLDASHAALVDATVRLMTRAGWECAVEVSFGVRGEHGSIDVLAWYAAASTLLVVEVKSVVPDVQATISVHDRKLRLGREIARERGWDATAVGRLLVVADGSTSRRRVASLATLFQAAYPQRRREVLPWLRDPVGSLSGLLFLPYVLPADTRSIRAGQQRVSARQRGGARSDRPAGGHPVLDAASQRPDGGWGRP